MDIAALLSALDSDNPETRDLAGRELGIALNKDVRCIQRARRWQYGCPSTYMHLEFLCIWPNGADGPAIAAALANTKHDPNASPEVRRHAQQLLDSLMPPEGLAEGIDCPSNCDQETAREDTRECSAAGNAVECKVDIVLVCAQKMGVKATSDGSSHDATYPTKCPDNGKLEHCFTARGDETAAACQAVAHAMTNLKFTCPTPCSPIEWGPEVKTKKNIGGGYTTSCCAREWFCKDPTAKKDAGTGGSGAGNRENGAGKGDGAGNRQGGPHDNGNVRHGKGTPKKAARSVDWLPTWGMEIVVLMLEPTRGGGCSCEGQCSCSGAPVATRDRSMAEFARAVTRSPCSGCSVTWGSLAAWHALGSDHAHEQRF